MVNCNECKNFESKKNIVYLLIKYISPDGKFCTIYQECSALIEVTYKKGNGQWSNIC